jgi:hypothetical protein
MINCPRSCSTFHVHIHATWSSHSCNVQYDPLSTMSTMCSGCITWLTRVYVNTHSINLSLFIVKEDMGCTHEDQSFLYRYILQQVADTAHWEALKEYHPDNMQTWYDIPSIIFFDSMEHLPIHLPYELKVGGLVQYRWMYQFERLEITHAM